LLHDAAIPIDLSAANRNARRNRYAVVWERTAVHVGICVQRNSPLAKIVGAICPSSLLARSTYCWYQQRQKNRDDRNHHQQLDQ
jgi:hypothetical protein